MRNTRTALWVAAGCAAASAWAADPPPRFEAVATFHSVGLYWSPVGGGEGVSAHVEYRTQGQTVWRRAQDLWYDARALGGRPAEYRGSIVDLAPGTSYEVRLSALADGAGETHTFTTWSEAFPIAQTVVLPGHASQTLEISNVHGSPEGYVLYTGPATNDVDNAADCNVVVRDCSYVILRGLTLRGARKHGIQLGAPNADGSAGGDDVHDIVVEGCDISGWGSADETGFGQNMHSALFSDSATLQRVVIQRNRLHHPRSNSNCWKEQHRTFHPEGPQGISFMAGQGQYVVRYNEIVGDATHHFNDSMGAWNNFSYAGFPNRDSDIYGNYVAYCWDDGLELEGADMNVRVWGNYITETYHAMATASVALGPLYVFRNIACISRTGPNHAYGQSFMKAGGVTNKATYYGDGRVYVYHNTVLSLPGSPEPQTKGGITDDKRLIRNYVTRNNIFETASPEASYCLQDKAQSTANDFDCDLYNGRLLTGAGAEVHGIVGRPLYAAGVGLDPRTLHGRFVLDVGSPGYDGGAVLPNFNDGYNGAAPDAGAQEAGTRPMEFGVNAKP